MNTRGQQDEMTRDEMIAELRELIRKMTPEQLDEYMLRLKGYFENK